MIQGCWSRSRIQVCLAVGAALLGPAPAPARQIDDYRLSRTFALPAPGDGSGGNVLLDALPDGRLLLVNGPEVLVETAVRSGSFAAAGTLPDFAPPFGPSFLAVAPGGAKAAVGTNGAGAVVVFDPADPAGATKFALDDTAGVWLDDRTLLVANGAGGSKVQALDTATASVTTLIANIGGATAGVAVDAAGNLYTGNAYSFGVGTSEAGWIKAFPPAAWQAALAGGAPVDFEASGTPVADLLSASPIVFDQAGNLFVGGADFFGGSGDAGYAAAVAASAVADALQNPQAMPPISGASPATVLRKIPSPQSAIDAFQSPNWSFNRATGELYLSYYQGSLVSAYAVPEPAAGALWGAASVALGTLRRRPRQPQGWHRAC